MASVRNKQAPVPDSASFLLSDSGKPPGLCPLLPSCSVISGKTWVEKRKGLLKVTPRKKRWQSHRPWLGPVWVDCESLAESLSASILSSSHREAEMPEGLVRRSLGGRGAGVAQRPYLSLGRTSGSSSEGVRLAAGIHFPWHSLGSC